MSTFTKVRFIFENPKKIFFLILDETKLQQKTFNDDDGDDDLPHIDLNEMLADMTMEDSNKMDS